jgi:hypothetical protein
VVADRHVDAGQAAIELGRRRDLARHEVKVVRQARGHGLGREGQRHPVRGLAERHWDEGQEQVTVLGGRPLFQDL